MRYVSPQTPTATSEYTVLCEKGYTVDQAAAELPDIPRSTIGYYYRINLRTIRPAHT